MSDHMCIAGHRKAVSVDGNCRGPSKLHPIFNRYIPAVIKSFRPPKSILELYWNKNIVCQNAHFIYID